MGNLKEPSDSDIEEETSEKSISAKLTKQLLSLQVGLPVLTDNK